MFSRKARIFIGVASVALPCLALAQPDVNQAPKADNPPNQAVGVGGRGGRGGGRGGMTNLTPAQLQQMQVQQAERQALMIKQRLTGAGFTDTNVQDAVVTYVTEQETARQTLQQQWTALQQAVRTTTTPDTQIATLLNNFRASIQDEKARRDKAYKALDAKAALAKKPRLDALLTTWGLIGEESAIVNGGGNLGGGRGGFGGGQGGGFGGGQTAGGFGALAGGNNGGGFGALQQGRGGRGNRGNQGNQGQTQVGGFGALAN